MNNVEFKGGEALKPIVSSKCTGRHGTTFYCSAVQSRVYKGAKEHLRQVINGPFRSLIIINQASLKMLDRILKFSKFIPSFRYYYCLSSLPTYGSGDKYRTQDHWLCPCFLSFLHVYQSYSNTEFLH